MKKQVLLFLFFLTPFWGFSQQQLGMKLERRSGIYAASINPSALSFTPSRWEVSLFSVDFFAHQNYGRLISSSVPRVLKSPELVVLLQDLANDPSTGTATKIPVDFYKKGRVFGVVQSTITGPGFAFRVNGQHSVGLTTSARFVASAYRVPSFFRYDQVSSLDYGTAYNIKPTQFNAMAWSEIKAAYAYRNFDGDRLFSWGICPKFLQGIQAGYTKVRANFDYTPIVQDTVQIGSAQWEYGFTTDALYASDPAQYRPRANGYGVGVDIGFSWAMPRDNADNAEDYWWRAGISILDLGGVRFGKNAVAHQVDFNAIAIVPGDTLLAAVNTSPQAAVQEVSRVLLGDPTASLRGNQFNMALPTVIAAQFDYGITSHFYVQGIITQRLAFFKHALRVPNTLAVIPRWEHQWLSLSVPIVLSDYRSPRVGVGARLGVLYIGSDDIASWLKKKSLTGTDGYIGLKINGFQLKNKRHQRKHSRSFWGGGLRDKDRHWKDVGCFNQ